MFPLRPCPCVSVFFILVGFCGFCLWFFLFAVIYFSSESSLCGYHYEYEKDSFTHTHTHTQTHTESSIFFCSCLIAILLGSLNPTLFSHCYLSLSLCMPNVHYYLATAILFLLLKLIMHNALLSVRVALLCFYLPDSHFTPFID